MGPFNLQHVIFLSPIEYCCPNKEFNHIRYLYFQIGFSRNFSPGRKMREDLKTAFTRKKIPEES